MQKLTILKLTGILLLFSFLALAQQTQAPLPTLESPSNTMNVHLYYLQQDSYRPEIAARCINLPGHRLQAMQLALQLKQIFDGKGLFVRLNMLPQEPDYRDTITQKPYYTPFPEQLPDVYLERINNQWYYSRQTTSAIPHLHQEIYPFGTDFLVNFFPVSASQRFLGLAIWQWLGMILLLFIAWAFHLIMSRLFRPVILMLIKSKYSQPLDDKSMIWKTARQTSFVVLLLMIKAFLPLLQLPVKMMGWIISGLGIAVIIMSIWLALSLIDVMIAYAYRFARSTERKMDEQVLPILSKALKVIAVLSGMIYILQLLDVNITALIAGVSIGGLALALAAQDTVKNLIGSAMIFFDQPFQIGDWVVCNGVEGTVREVGFRSTRIELMDNSIVSVPNDQIASSAITNMGLRTYRLLKTTLGVTYDTPPILLEKFIEGLRRIVAEHPKTRKDNYLVYFHSFGESSLNIYFRTHFQVTTFQEELQEREKIAFAILQLANKLGVRFAFPTQTLFVEEIPGGGKTTPTYETDRAKLEEKMNVFFEKYASEITKSHLPAI